VLVNATGGSEASPQAQMMILLTGTGLALDAHNFLL